MARGPLRVTRAGRIPNATPAFGTLDFACRTLPSGKRQLMEWARLAEGMDPRVDQVVIMWNHLSRYKQGIVPLDELCAVAGLTAGELFGVVARATFEFYGTAAMALLACASVDVMHAAVTRACTPQGSKDRRVLFEMSGVLPCRSRGGRPLR